MKRKTGREEKGIVRVLPHQDLFMDDYLPGMEFADQTPKIPTIPL